KFGAAATAANAASSAAVVSHDGSTIAFVSAATDLVNNQAGSGGTGVSNVFVYRTGSGVVSLVSGVLGSLTTAGNGNSDSPAVSGNGGYVAYRSDATNLVLFGQT